MNLRKVPFLVPAVRLIRRLAGITAGDLDIKKSRKRTPGMIADYLNSHKSPRLHIGCQHHPMNDWLNVDILPGDPKVAFMDATQPFPLPDQTFDYIFSEHMIEHINLEQGGQMLSECYRIMRTGGRIRIVTPDIDLLRNILLHPDTDDHKDYINFSRRYFNNPCVFNEVVVVNNFFRDWGHQFIYNEATLVSLLVKAGFRDVVRLQVGNSSDPVLRDLENHHMEITDKFNRMESLILEGVK